MSIFKCDHRTIKLRNKKCPCCCKAFSYSRLTKSLRCNHCNLRLIFENKSGLLQAINIYYNNILIIIKENNIYFVDSSINKTIVVNNFLIINNPIDYEFLINKILSYMIFF